MAKGSISKEALTAKILETFDGAFIYGKEIRVPYVENGEQLQIKVTLTCAKENVESETTCTAASIESAFPTPVAKAQPTVSVPTEDEKARVAQLLESLGL